MHTANCITRDGCGARRHLLVVLLVAAALALSSLALDVDSAAAATFTERSNAFDLLSATNSERAAAGLAPLRMSSGLVGLAEAHSRRMIARNDLRHATKPELAAQTDTVTTRWTTAGENIGVTGLTGSDTDIVQRLSRAFMASPEHRANVLDARYRYAGVGVVRTATAFWVTVRFLATPVTLPLLGDPRPQWPPAAGAFIRIDGGNRTIYRVIGGAAVPLNNCATVSCSNIVGYTRSQVESLPGTPRDGTFITGTDNRTIWRMAGGTPLPLYACAPLGGCGGVLQANTWSVSQMMSRQPVPRDGTVLRGLPSGRYWRIAGGLRRALAAGSPAAVAVNDATVSGIPLASS